MNNSDFIKALDERIAELKSINADIEFNLDNFSSYVRDMKKYIETAKDIF